MINVLHIPKNGSKNIQSDITKFSLVKKKLKNKQITDIGKLEKYSLLDVDVGDYTSVGKWSGGGGLADCQSCLL